MALDTLAAYYVQLARKEKDREHKKEYFAQVRSRHVAEKMWMVFFHFCGKCGISF